MFQVSNVRREPCVLRGVVVMETLGSWYEGRYARTHARTVGECLAVLRSGSYMILVLWMSRMGATTC